MELNIWFILALLALNSISIIISGVVVGYLVFRTKKESHERLFPKDRKKRKGPIVIDEFARKEEEDEGLPDIIKKMNNDFLSGRSTESLKGNKDGR